MPVGNPGILANLHLFSSHAILPEFRLTLEPIVFWQTPHKSAWRPTNLVFGEAWTHPSNKFEMFVSFVVLVLGSPGLNRDVLEGELFAAEFQGAPEILPLKLQFSTRVILPSSRSKAPATIIPGLPGVWAVVLPLLNTFS